MSSILLFCITMACALSVDVKLTTGEFIKIKPKRKKKKNSRKNTDINKPDWLK